jgi:dipeptidyl aminopeptidase/acylaminoacyl peptidase
MRFARHIALAAALGLATSVAAQPQLTYQQPPAPLREVLDATPLPARLIDPSGTTLALVEARRYPSIEELSRPFLRLAGLRIDPAANGPHRTGHINRITLRALADPSAAAREVRLPAGGDFYDMEFAPDGKRFSILRRTTTGTQLWLGETATGELRQVEGVALQNAGRRAVRWMGSDAVVALTLPANRGSMPATPVPTGPVVQENLGRKNPERTYQDLLRTPHDEAVFAYMMTAELSRIEAASGRVKVIHPAGLYESVNVVGDGRHLLVERLARPFSYVVPYEDFGNEVTVIDREGAVVKTLERVALKENVPVQGVIKGPRRYTSSVLADASIYWLEALDGGDPRARVPHRDRLLKLAAPYSGAPVEVAKFAHRVVRTIPLEDGRLLVTEFDRDRVWTKTSIVDPASPGADPKLLFDISARDRYNAPGAPLTRVLPVGRTVGMVSDGQMLFAGEGATTAGDRPFLDRWNLADRTKQRLFSSAEGRHESVVRALDGKGNRFVTVRESPTEPPNLYLHTAGASPLALTAFADPTPQLRGIKRQLVKFKRQDGVDQSFWLYQPADQKPGEKRPAFLWAYPQEFTDAALAGQVSGSPNRFQQFAGTSPLFLALDGFVVLADVTMPIVGDPEKVNDTFVQQVTMNAQAAIDKAVEMGVVDRSRIAVGGHSYGAFMSANLMAHTDLFKTAIARSGAYNRTLTPFGFQSERRTLWEAPEAYAKVSPLLYADRIKKPIMLMHGADDDNSGTFPEQTDRLYAALAGNGGTVRFVKLPSEAHGYTARESVGHTLWEMSTWLRKHLGDPRSPQ